VRNAKAPVRSPCGCRGLTNYLCLPDNCRLANSGRSRPLGAAGFAALFEISAANKAGMVAEKGGSIDTARVARLTACGRCTHPISRGSLTRCRLDASMPSRPDCLSIWGRRLRVAQPRLNVGRRVVRLLPVVLTPDRALVTPKGPCERHKRSLRTLRDHQLASAELPMSPDPRPQNWLILGFRSWLTCRPTTMALCLSGSERASDS
jgi:hypothetical protein